MNQEIIDFLITIAPSVASIIAMIFTFITALRKFVNTINEFKQSNELKEQNQQINALIADNAELKKLNQKLLVELTRIKPLGWSDEQQKN